MVTKDEIVSNDYDLSINKYKKVVYEEEKYLPSSEIIAEMRKLVDTLSDELKVLEEMIR